MNWEAIGAVAEFVGAIAVVITLIYLISQLRQNTKALRSSSYASIHQQEDDFLAEMARDPILARLEVKATLGVEILDESERLQWSWLGRRIVYMFHNFHYQRHLGGVDESIAAAWDNAWSKYLISNKGVRQTYETVKPSLSKGFIVYTDSIMDRNENRENA